MFADVVGFTAWLSTREPAQVFMLPESIHKQFDQIAKQRHVFKVEMVRVTEDIGPVGEC